jgi:hypothetical protein
MIARSVKLVALLGLAVTYAGLPQANSLGQSARHRFCQFSEKQSSGAGQPNPLRRTIDNREKRNLAALISLEAPFVRIESRSPDWKNEAEALARVLEVVASKPGFLTPGPGWSELVIPEVRGVIATLDDSRKARMEIAGFHVCVQDSLGQVWFFRTVPVDGWIR